LDAIASIHFDRRWIRGEGTQQTRLAHPLIHCVGFRVPATKSPDVNSSRVIRIDAVEPSQHRRPFDLAEGRTLAPETLRCGGAAHLFRRNIERGAGRLGGKLRLTGLLQMMEDAEGFGDIATNDQQAMVAQNHRRVGAEIAHQALALVEIERKPFVVVIAKSSVKELGVLRQRQQPVPQHRYRHPGDRMGMDDAAGVGARAMHGAVDDETSFMNAGAAAVDHVAVEIDAHEAGCRDFVEGKAEGIE
jgi:hypothetical protein